jgi:hypothetical protein
VLNLGELLSVGRAQHLTFSTGITTDVLELTSKRC